MNSGEKYDENPFSKLNNAPHKMGMTPTKLPGFSSNDDECNAPRCSGVINDDVSIFGSLPRLYAL